MNDIIEHIELLRLDASRKLAPGRKAELGQFLTPAPAARLMASMPRYPGPTVSILDPGAGVGSLFAACVEELCRRTNPPEEIRVTAFEVDPSLAGYLPDTMQLCKKMCAEAGIAFEGCIRQKDFIEAAVDKVTGSLFSSDFELPINCAILNPPYRKIQTGSAHSKLLQKAGMQTTNLYTGFLALCMELLEPQGELVAITPRSFCNGLYFKPFRERLLRTLSLRRFHLFTSREQAFREDDVLQENLILYAVKSPQGPDAVEITTSEGSEDEFLTTRTVPYEQVVHPNDPQVFIHIVPDEVAERVKDQMAQFAASLDDLALNVSTGRVVEFRATSLLHVQPQTHTVPLLYPTHLRGGTVIWPKLNTRKPQAIVMSEQSSDLLIPNQNYVLVKRFTSKEEAKRVVAAVYDASRFPGECIGLENHLNYFHENNHGLALTLAKGLAAFLNSTLVDLYFRLFNGHTQVNATDLRNIAYPSRRQLEDLGARLPEAPDQDTIDSFLSEELLTMPNTASDPVRITKRIHQARAVLKDLGLPANQQNERSALTLLAILDLKADQAWSKAKAPLRGITQLMDFFAMHYGKRYAPNTRETVRRQTVHQFLEAGLVVANPDEPSRPINSGKTVYQINSAVLNLLRTYRSKQWDMRLREYQVEVEPLKKRYAQDREMQRIPVTIAVGKTITLSPGGQNVLVEQIIKEFADRFVPGGKLLYVGDTDTKFAYFDAEGQRALGVELEPHGKMPDVIIHDERRNWLVLIEAVTSHGPIDPKRHAELVQLFSGSQAGLVLVTAFSDRKIMKTYLADISWETEVWVAESPAHLIHFNGERFLGPYQKEL